MSITTTWDFSAAGDYVITSGIEITGGRVQSKDQRPTDATFYAAFSDDINGNWGDGLLPGTAVGGASIVGGELDCTGGTVKHVQLPAADNFAIGSTGCIRFMYRPNYSGTPSGTRFLFNATGAGNANKIALYCASGFVYLVLYNSAGGLLSSVAVGSWSPVAGVQYEIELDVDVTTGATRLFISGFLVGTVATTGTRTATGFTTFEFGGSGAIASDGKFSKLVLFSAVQHIATYTPGYTIPATKYPTTEQTVYPSGLLNTDDLESIANTGTATGVRYIMQKSGTQYYWTGTAWAISDGTYAQANQISVLTPVILLQFLDTVNCCVRWRAVIQSDGATQEYLDDVTMEYSAAGTIPAFSKTVIRGFLYNLDGTPASGKTVTCKIASVQDAGQATMIRPEALTATTDIAGYWEIEIVHDADRWPQMLIWNIDGRQFTTGILDQSAIDFDDLL